MQKQTICRHTGSFSYDWYLRLRRWVLYGQKDPTTDKTYYTDDIKGGKGWLHQIEGCQYRQYGNASKFRNNQNKKKDEFKANIKKD